MRGGGTEMRRQGLALLVAVALLTAALPQTARAGDPYLAAYYYEKCMKQAEDRMEICVDILADEIDDLCWSGYGWAKIYCSLKYGYDLLRKE